MVKMTNITHVGLFTDKIFANLHWEKYMFVMTISGPNGKYFPIDNKRILLIKMKQIITSEQSKRSRIICLHIRKTNYNVICTLVLICFIVINKIRLLSIGKYSPLGPDIVIINMYFSQCMGSSLCMVSICKET